MNFHTKAHLSIIFGIIAFYYLKKTHFLPNTNIIYLNLSMSFF